MRPFVILNIYLSYIIDNVNLKDNNEKTGFGNHEYNNLTTR